MGTGLFGVRMTYLARDLALAAVDDMAGYFRQRVFDGAFSADLPTRRGRAHQAWVQISSPFSSIARSLPATMGPTDPPTLTMA